MYVVQIYYASEEFGVHDIRTSGGYFHMADVFQQQGNISVAQSLYRQVFTHISRLFYILTAYVTNSQVNTFCTVSMCLSASTLRSVSRLISWFCVKADCSQLILR